MIVSKFSIEWLLAFHHRFFFISIIKQHKLPEPKTNVVFDGLSDVLSMISRKAWFHFLILFFYQRISCKASLTTVMISAGCPSDPYTLGERKRALSCQTVHQNCTEPANFRYHCVLNEYANQSIEVCAVATSIIGKGKVIIMH